MSTKFFSPIVLLIFGFILNTILVLQNGEDIPDLTVTNGNYKIQIYTKLRSGSEAFETLDHKSGDAIFYLNLQLCLIFDLVLRSGDICANPGPKWKFSCIMCIKPVKSNQKDIYWGYCDRWLHTHCYGINDYLRMNGYLANSSSIWICPASGTFNFSSILLNSTPDINKTNS